MEKRIKSQFLYPAFSLVCIGVAFLLLCLDVSKYIIMFILFLSVIGFLFNTLYIKRQLFMLIEAISSIIDQKPIKTPTIDGESYIAVLSSHLSLLEKRMKGMLERLNQDKLDLKDYIEDISHQLRTPLTSQLLEIEMLLEFMEEDEKKQLVQQIYHQNLKMKNLIEALLQLAKVESHSIQYQKEEYSLEVIMDNINETLFPLKEKYNVNFHYENINYLIYCDEKWISEALENILKNCIEQTQNSLISIYCQNYSSYIEIYIQDQGEGFDEENMKHVFDRFYRGKSSYQGFGIGLSISKGIIEDHLGSIDIRNHNGALFKITLPHKNTKSKFSVTD